MWHVSVSSVATTIASWLCADSNKQGHSSACHAPSVVHCKFRTDRRWNIRFEGASISVLELKACHRAEREHMERSVQDFDLSCTTRRRAKVRAIDRGKGAHRASTVTPGSDRHLGRDTARAGDEESVPFGSARRRVRPPEAPVKDDGSGSSVHDAETDGE